MTSAGRTDWRRFGREQAEQLMRTRTPLEAVGLIVIIMTEGGKVPAQQLGAVAAGAVEAYRAAESPCPRCSCCRSAIACPAGECALHGCPCGEE